MKFLCVKCDEPMKLTKSAPPDRGSLSIVYTCPDCDHQIAMLTNPFETQVVQSMGVKIGPKDDSEASTGDLSGSPLVCNCRTETANEGLRPHDIANA